MTGYVGTWYRKEFGTGCSPKDRKWPQGNGYGKRYGTRERKGQISPIDQMGPKAKLTIPYKNQERMVNISQ